MAEKIRSHHTIIEERLKAILGGTYGGPSLSFVDGKFVLYVWSDAPVNEDVLVRAKSLESLIEQGEIELKRRKRKVA